MTVSTTKSESNEKIGILLCWKLSTKFSKLSHQVSSQMIYAISNVVVGEFANKTAYIYL